MAFYIMDPFKLPEKKEDLIQYCYNELQDLDDHYDTRIDSRVAIVQIDNVQKMPFIS